MSTADAATATRLRAAIDADAAQVLAWRNHPAVRRVMFTDHTIGADEHRRWWQHVMASADHRILIVEHDERGCGVVTFSRTEPAASLATGEAWSWGFYLDPDAFAPGADALRAWSGMESASLRYAADQLRAQRIDCEVFAFNAAVLALHKRHGFVERERYQRQRGEEAFEVVRLSRTLG